MSEMRAVGRVAAKAFAYFLFFSTLALIVGLIVANVVRPGEGMNIDPATLNSRGDRDLFRAGARKQRHRLPARHHPDDDGLGADRRLDPAGAVRRHPVRRRHCRWSASRPRRWSICSSGWRGRVPDRRDPDARRADRRVRGDRVHDRRLWRRHARQSRRAGRDLLPDVVDLRARRARAESPRCAASRS